MQNISHNEMLSMSKSNYDSSTGSYSSSSSSKSSQKSPHLQPVTTPKIISVQSKNDAHQLEIKRNSVHSNNKVKSVAPIRQPSQPLETQPIQPNSNGNMEAQTPQQSQAAQENQMQRPNSNNILEDQISQQSQPQEYQSPRPNLSRNWKKRRFQSEMQRQRPQMHRFVLFRPESQASPQLHEFNYVSNRQMQQESQMEPQQQPPQQNDFGTNSEIQYKSPRLNRQQQPSSNIFIGPIRKYRHRPMPRHLLRQNSNNNSSLELFHQNRRNRPHIFRRPINHHQSHYSISQSLVDSSSISRKRNQPLPQNSYNNNIAQSLNFNRPLFSGSSEKSSFAKTNGFGSF